MKLYTCHVENFGRLHDLDLDFREKLHVVREDNGWGKSTLAAFLLVMFYGFANEKSRSEITSERRRFAPWQQGLYGGTVTFSFGDRILRLERVFGSKNAGEDSSAVYDAETNLPVPGFADNPGEAVFSIDRESFARTVFIAQQDCGTEATSGIQAKIGHLEGEPADLADFHQVQMSLKKMADRLTPDRKTGEIYKIRQKLAELESDVSRRPVYEQTIEKLKGQMDIRAREMRQLRAETDTAQEELRQFAVIQRTAEDLALEEEEQERLDQLEAMFSSGIPDEQQMDEAEACFREIRKMRRDFEQAQRELYEPGAEKEDGQPSRPGTSLISVLVFALFASALLAFFLNKAVAAVLAVLAVVIMVAVVRRDMKKEKEEGPRKPVVVVKQNTSPISRVTDMRARREKLKETRKEILEAEAELREFLQQYHPELTEEEDLSRNLQQLQYEKAEYLALVRREERSRAAEEAWRQRICKTEPFHDGDAVTEAFYGGDSVTESFNVRDAETEPRYAGNPKTGQKEFSVSELEKYIADNRKRIETAETEMHTLTRQLEAVLEQLEHAAGEEERLADIREELAVKEHRYEILTQTREYLGRARTAFAARYMEPVRRAFDRYYRMLAGSEAKEYQLDADLRISVREYGLLRNPDLLSEGWQDLIGLCRRMAMIDVMYEGEKPFLLLDDPFVNLDGEKVQRALAFLKQIAENYQVIYFTCHESRVP